MFRMAAEQSAQNVHSYEQIAASESPASRRPQRSQADFICKLTESLSPCPVRAFPINSKVSNVAKF